MFSKKALGVCCVAVMSAAVPAKQASAQCGKASWYHEGTRTASGERYRPDGITAAHRTLPLGSVVQVTHQRTGRTVTVRINDRGPFIRGRIIDLSRGAKRVIGMDGLAPVCIAVVGRGGSGKVADAGPSLFGSDDSTEQPRANRRGRHNARMANLDGSQAERRHHTRRHHARLARWDSDQAESRQLSRRQRVARAEIDSDDVDTSETSSRRHRRQASADSRAHSRHDHGYRNSHAGWPGSDWNEM